MIRTEFNVATGESVVINVFAYKNNESAVIFLDDGELPPGGYTQITDEEAETIASSKPESVRIKIASLEAAITPRRLREAVLTGDSSFIAGVEAQIAALRLLLS